MRGIAIVALLLLGACGQAKNDKAVISYNGGKDGLAADGSIKIDGVDSSADPASAECAGRPDYVPLYPGAKIMTCMPLGNGGQIIFTAPTDPATVLAFYKKAAADAHLTERVTESANSYAARGTPDTRRFTVQASVEGDGTMGHVIYGTLN